MEIQYLKKLVKNATIDGRSIVGVSEKEIQEVEKKFNITFPKAYREFLLLAGKRRGQLPLYDTSDLETLAADWHQEIMWEELEMTNATKDFQRPFWLFAESNACEQFVFFYLDDGDDPTVYSADYKGLDADKKEIKSLKRPFSTFIDQTIDQAYYYLKHGW